MALKQAFAAARSGSQHVVEKVEHILILGVLVAACAVAVVHGFDKGSGLVMKLVFAMVLVAAVGMEFRACKNMVISFHQRHGASAIGWAALWVICAASTLYVSFGTAAKNIDDVAVLQKTSFVSYEDAHGKKKRLEKEFGAANDAVATLRSQATFKTEINGVVVTTAEAAQQMIEKAEAHKFWALTASCTATKGKQTTDFCAEYRQAKAAKATAGGALLRREELAVAEKDATRLRKELFEAEHEAKETKTVISEEAPHIKVLASLTGIDSKQARVVDGMQLPLLMQALLSLAAVLMAIEMCRGMPRPPSKIKAWVASLWDSSTGTVSEASVVDCQPISPTIIHTRETVLDEALKRWARSGEVRQLTAA